MKKEIRVALARHLEKLDFLDFLEYDEDQGAFLMGITYRNEHKVVFLVVPTEFGFYIQVKLAEGPDESSKQEHYNLLRFLNLVNQHLAEGNMVVESYGNVFYWKYTRCVDGPISDDLVGNNLAYAVAMCDKYCDGLWDVISGVMSPEEAMERCEENFSAFLRMIGKID